MARSAAQEQMFPCLTVRTPRSLGVESALVAAYVVGQIVLSAYSSPGVGGLVSEAVSAVVPFVGSEEVCHMTLLSVDGVDEVLWKGQDLVE